MKSITLAVTKRTKASTARKSAGKEAVVLDAGLQIVPISSDFDDELDDILGELVDETAKPAPKPAAILHVVGAEAGDTLDDILNGLAEPDSPTAEAGFDDILSEIAGPEPTVDFSSQPTPEPDLDDILSALEAPAAPAGLDASLDDILGEVAPAPQPESSLDDILSQLTAPAAPVVEQSLDDILSEVGRATPSPVETVVAPAPVVAPGPVPPTPPAAAIGDGEASPARKPGFGARIARLAGSLTSKIKLPRLQAGGTRQISHKAYFSLIGLTGLFASVAVGEAVFIIARPAAHAPARAVHVPGGTTLVPVDYSKVDLDLYRDKVRSLGEGGRDMLRHARIKAAVVGLDNGEQLYADLRALAARSPAADRIDVQNGRVSISSCAGGACADKSFKLVYDIARETASVCLTEKYIDGAMMSYSYSAEGYRERPGC
jgi:hypothetical protein